MKRRKDTEERKNAHSLSYKSPACEGTEHIDCVIGEVRIPNLVISFKGIAADGTDAGGHEPSFTPANESCPKGVDPWDTLSSVNCEARSRKMATGLDG